MKTKTLVILLLILGALAGAGTLIIRLKAPERSQGRLGTHLLDQLPANEIMSITIQSPDEAVSLKKKKDLWVVTNRFDYPADFSKIIDMVRKLKEATIGRQFEASEDTRERLSLRDPDDSNASKEAKGIRILLKDEKESPLARILLGKTRNTGTEGSFSEGRYVMLGEDSTIYLIDEQFSLFEMKPSSWLDQTLVKVAADEVKKISIVSGEGEKVLYAFERPEKGKDLEAVNLSSHQKIRKSNLNRLSGALSSLHMEDVVNPSTSLESLGMGATTRMEYHLFDGTIYRVYPGRECSKADPCYLRLEVDYQKPSGEKVKPAGDESDKKQQASPEKTPEEYAREAKQLNNRLSPWVYVIPQWQHRAFITDLDQLLEKSDKRPTRKNK